MHILLNNTGKGLIVLELLGLVFEWWRILYCCTWEQVPPSEGRPWPRTYPLWLTLVMSACFWARICLTKESGGPCPCHYPGLWRYCQSVVQLHRWVGGWDLSLSRLALPFPKCRGILTVVSKLVNPFRVLFWALLVPKNGASVPAFIVASSSLSSMAGKAMWWKAWHFLLIPPRLLLGKRTTSSLSTRLGRNGKSVYKGRARPFQEQVPGQVPAADPCWLACP